MNKENMSVIAKMMTANKNGEGVNLTADDVKQFFQLSIQAIQPAQKTEKSFDEIADEINDEKQTVNQPVVELRETTFKVVVLKNQNIDELEKEICAITIDDTKEFLTMQAIDYQPIIGFYCAVFYRQI